MFSKKSSKKDYFKFKELRVYGSLESLFTGARRYRFVFDETEACYVNIELSFYNILFNEEDWEANIVMRLIDYNTNQEITKLDKKVTVAKDVNLVYVHDGWGTPNPGYWKKGIYKWQILIEEEQVGESYFYIVNNGQVSATENPYFNIKSIKLFESPYEGTPIADRVYLQAFGHDKTRYINLEMTLENKLQYEPYFPLELQFYVYTENVLVKAYMSYFKYISDKPQEIVLDTGYGTRNPGFWVPGSYTLHVLFMDKVLSIIPFTVGNEDEPFTGSYPTPAFVQTISYQQPPETQPLTFEEAKAELEELIGLTEVKKQLNEFATYLQFIQLRQKKGLPETEKFNLHTVFMGNPGTGKTTVARMLGKIYKSLGVLPNGDVHEISRADLVAEYIGQTAPKTKKAIDDARGGILFIDEAYSLTNRGDDEKDFGREVIEVLIKEMSDGPGNIAIICAGYTREMEQFLASNPGLASRFKQVIEFPDYTPDELMSIAQYTAKKKDVILHPDTLKLIEQNVVEAYRNRDRTFGNARYVNGIVEEGKRNMGLRIMGNMTNPDADFEKLTAEDLSTITMEDVQKIFAKQKKQAVLLPIDNPLLEEALFELNSLVGLTKIKNEVHEIVKLVKYYREIGRSLQSSFSLHTVFSGNPGTGKTTVARILVKIYKALGILERGHLVECDRKMLVAAYIGQTALKTAAVIEQAMGGGLFIDEAYALSQGGGQDFGREAIEVLLKRMEDDRGRFMVIAAGYTKEMKLFLESNPGLKSRFDKNFLFEDYSAAELLSIAVGMFAKEKLELESAAKSYLENFILQLTLKKSKDFGNARVIRQIVTEVVKKHHLMLAEMPTERRSEQMVNTVTLDTMRFLDDPNALNISTDGTGKIGF
ncbi:stage V sporulation protein K [Sphingobacteriales bacterium UPWRP_1]|nr:stage V sporulation protein K [Sphingobacteriales bacterium TSM_CSS]PSJ77219.1 stage V sporulation protein K [Sphingobacteriales bacterium UPWRP_1]